MAPAIIHFFCKHVFKVKTTVKPKAGQYTVNSIDLHEPKQTLIFRQTHKTSDGRHGGTVRGFWV